MPRPSANLTCGASSTGRGFGPRRCARTTRITAKRKEIDRWHREERGWRKIGYHHLIDRDGAILPGRAETEIGAGVEGHNRGVIHICLIGGAGSSATDPFERNFTAAQDRALRGLIDAIRAETAITRITGHNDHADLLPRGGRARARPSEGSPELRRA